MVGAGTFLDPTEGEKQILDLVAKVGTNEPVEFSGGTVTTEQLLLIHIEVEAADKTTLLLPRLASYYRALRGRYGLPVIPMALFLRVGMTGRGWGEVAETLWGVTLSRQAYRFVGLPALEGERYLEG